MMKIGKNGKLVHKKVSLEEHETKKINSTFI